MVTQWFLLNKGNNMKIWELLTLVLFGFILGLAMFVGLKLDDKAQQTKEATWERFEEIDNAIK